MPYSRQSINQDDIEAVCSVLRSDWITQGPKVKEFEEALAEQCGAKHCIVVSNGTVALQLACMALEIGPGDLGLTSPLSFLASANCIAYCGGTPDFVDIDRATLCLSPDGVRRYCEEIKIPKVVVPVDFAGIPADLPGLKKLSEKFGFFLLEDAAHSIGSTYQCEGREYKCGSCHHTDLAIFSFHPVKSITTGEGGAVLTNNDRLAKKLRLLSNHGVERGVSRFLSKTVNYWDETTGWSSSPWYYEMQALGFNARITDIQCALGISQLKRLETFKKRRQEIVGIYNEAFVPLEREEIVTLPPWPENTDPCFHLYPLRLGVNSTVRRDDLFLELRKRGIYCQVHYIPIYRQPFYGQDHERDFGRFPETEKYFAGCLSLPLFPDMDHATVQYVIDAVIGLLSPS
ncbi:MAG: UDP-4-amino-4,6-dideoxy-N-acetyl-beta-L-altrosamine transaminase [Deltaproteobacteria bacterium]|nr:UDP-4-amino-4,6-dideoxy-N-acetyl-beta-L-altrosamine transaminase [Deltaproteobacteria bacterium]MBW2063903.1 UDP-4-amino-4,6-dideoxy-N-acetyl-beta-L-altrosamine transaminase [Deltaproteobacteria bacterium]